jgi:hypothetical protein
MPEDLTLADLTPADSKLADSMALERSPRSSAEPGLSNLPWNPQLKRKN